MLKLQVFRDHELASQFAANWMADHLRAKPDSIVCLAAGATPMRAYELLVERAAAEPMLTDRLRIIKLDEWCVLPTEHPATCEQHLRNVIIKPLGMTDRYIGFESQPEHPENECSRIANWLNDNGPIDVCVLGLGLNGHLGFNEPAAALEPHAHVAQLSAESRAHAMVSTCETPPMYGLTLGMADLLKSRHILMIVTGTAKRGALERLLSGPIATDFPASLLQLHGDVRVVCDEAAMGAR